MPTNKEVKKKKKTPKPTNEPTKIFNEKTGVEEWAMRFQLNKKEYYPVASSRKKLLEIVDEIRADSHRKKFELPTAKANVTLARLVAAQVEKFDLTKKNPRRNKTVLENFAAHFPEDFNLHELDSGDIARYIAKRQKESSLKAWSVHSELTQISAMLKRAPELLKELAGYRPPRIPWVKVPTAGSGRVITSDERLILLDALRAPRGKIEALMGKNKIKGERLELERDVFVRHELADMFEIALHTGMRWGEICRIEWRFFDERENVINLPKEITKTQAARTVYLSRRIMEILKRRKSNSETIWIFPNDAKTHYRKYYSKPLRTIAKRLKLNYGQEIDGGFTPHSTRHTAISLMLRVSDIETVREISGHTKKSMTMIYSHTDSTRKQQAVESLSEILDE